MKLLKNCGKMAKKKVEVGESLNESSNDFSTENIELENSETSEIKTNTIFNQGCRRHRLRFQGH